MSETNALTRKTNSLGDAAVDGLLNGVIAGFVMGLYVFLVRYAFNVPILEMLVYFGNAISNLTISPIIGAIIHLAISGIYGVFYGLLYSLLANRWRAFSSTWVPAASGLAYGAFLWLVAIFILFRGFQIEGILGSHLLIAHLIYGLILGLLTRRSSSETSSGN